MVGLLLMLGGILVGDILVTATPDGLLMSTCPLSSIHR
jgi:hypothetical protein